MIRYSLQILLSWHVVCCMACDVMVTCIGLELNPDKCEHVAFNSESRVYFRTGNPLCQCSCKFCKGQDDLGSMVPSVHEVKYLGVRLEDTGGASRFFTDRITKTNTVASFLPPFSVLVSFPNRSDKGYTCQLFKIFSCTQWNPLLPRPPKIDVWIQCILGYFAKFLTSKALTITKF